MWLGCWGNRQLGLGEIGIGGGGVDTTHLGRGTTSPTAMGPCGGGGGSGKRNGVGSLGRRNGGRRQIKVLLAQLFLGLNEPKCFGATVAALLFG
jgi:hypothetical protein